MGRQGSLYEKHLGSVLREMLDAAPRNENGQVLLDLPKPSFPTGTPLGDEFARFQAQREADKKQESGQ